MLHITDQLPEGFLQTGPQELHNILSGPTLIHLQGRRQQPLFVSVLLHGNETTGFYAVQKLLQKYSHQALPRSLSLFVGNVTAARTAERRLNGQVDYNRVWPHRGFSHDSVECNMMGQVVQEMQQRDVFLSVDIHNNTGLNPHYACINRLDNAFYHLATLFSRTVIYFVRPKGVQSQAFAELCPAVTVECGQTENHHGIEHALEYLQACLDLSELPTHPVHTQDMDLFHTVATVKVAPHIRFSFSEESVDLLFESRLDLMNFSELKTGTRWGKVNVPDDADPVLTVMSETGEDVVHRYFRQRNGELLTTGPIMPSMLTTQEDIIRKDCLCYLMERMPLKDAEAAELS
ncbi:MAG: M14 family metallopeptidase [Gammaproteobacteria bacterium]|nr:M14 family metallopeptidase [Gammaproteobacteria bacterium]MDH5799584.1 M14 family metallopeptidase [Gammaproteobacteria bacterium]